MISADEIRDGTILLIDGKLYKAIGVEFGGTAKFGRVVHVKLQNLLEGTFTEKTFQGSGMVEDIHLDKYDMEYLYNDGDNFHFMNTQTYEQFPVSKEIVGTFATYLRENTTIQVEFYKGTPVNIVFPKIMELKVVSAPPAMHTLDSDTPKQVTLENDMEVLVPQFVKEGDIVRIEVSTGKYMDRVKK
ncbi:MAG: elongation factor P [bacterium]